MLRFWGWEFFSSGMIVHLNHGILRKAEGNAITNRFASRTGWHSRDNLDECFGDLAQSQNRSRHENTPS